MIAIPIKMGKEESAVAPLFGKAKYFAIANKGVIRIVKNEKLGGNQVAIWLQSLGVKKVIVQHMGINPFHKLQNLQIDVYFAGEERIMLKEALLKYADGDLVRVNEVNFSLFFDEDHHHSHEHSHEGEHHGHGGHHHHHQIKNNKLSVPLGQNGTMALINFKY